MKGRAAWAQALTGHPASAGSGTPLVVTSTGSKKRRTVPRSFLPKPRVSRSEQLTRMLAQLAEIRAADERLPVRQELDVVPVPKPRMSRRDAWESRDAVVRYRAFCDEVRLKGAKLPHAYRAIFVLPMPASWSDDMKAAMAGKPMLSRPDTSNLIKALEDALVPNDEVLFCISGRKFWGHSGSITILKEPMDLALVPQ